MGQKKIQALSGIKIFTRPLFSSELGLFSEVYRKNNFKEDFAQDSFSISHKKNTLRGMHFQNQPFAQGKLVTVLSGSIVDFVVDIRKNSSTYKEYASIKLSRDNGKMIYIPEGFAHGFQTLEENTCVLYKLSNYYSPEHEMTLKWNDPTIGIEWEEKNIVHMSDKDKAGKLFTTIEQDLSF
jgi:dTDP-4-dehydrorhamnose 3,5-epimerase